MSATWTKAHWREATARTHEIVAAMVRGGGVASAPEGGATCGHEGEFRWWLKVIAALDVDDIAREVRRVRGLAEGRLVRSEERGYRIAHPGGGRSNVVTRQQALDSIAAAGAVSRATCVAVAVRVTRIRRAS